MKKDKGDFPGKKLGQYIRVTGPLGQQGRKKTTIKTKRLLKQLQPDDRLAAADEIAANST